MSKYSFIDFSGLFGMHELEAGVAAFANRAHETRSKLADAELATHEIPEYFDLVVWGWIMKGERVGQWRLAPEAVERMCRRCPELRSAR